MATNADQWKWGQIRISADQRKWREIRVSAGQRKWRKNTYFRGVSPDLPALLPGGDPGLGDVLGGPRARHCPNRHERHHHGCHGSAVGQRTCCCASSVLHEGAGPVPLHLSAVRVLRHLGVRACLLSDVQDQDGGQGWGDLQAGALFSLALRIGLMNKNTSPVPPSLISLIPD